MKAIFVQDIITGNIYIEKGHGRGMALWSVSLRVQTKPLAIFDSDCATTVHVASRMTETKDTATRIGARRPRGLPSYDTN